MVQIFQGQGYALTVFRSPRIRRFDVHLIGDLPDAGTAGNRLILARASGHFIDQIGGVPAGASGSPVFIDDRLIGAISAVFAPDYTLVGITPIEEMMAILSLPATKAGAARPLVSQGPTIPVATGFSSPRALAELRKRMAQDLWVLPGSPARMSIGTFNTVPTGTVQPGSPLGVAILFGDISLGTIGTTTFVEDDVVLGFGHPAFFLGPVDQVLTAPIILDVGRGQIPFKVGDLGQAIGTVVQDRSAGIKGRLNRRPRMVALEFHIIDTDLDREVTIKTQATPAPSWLPFLTFLATLESFQRAMDRTGGGTASWDWTIKVENQQDVNVYGSSHDAFDIAGLVATAVDEPLTQLLESGAQILSIRLHSQVQL